MINVWGLESWNIQMTSFDTALALIVAASTGFGMMLGYGWLYPKYWQAEHDLDDYYDAQSEWLSGLQRERTKLLGVQVDLDIIKRERAAFKAKQRANGKKARAVQLAAQKAQAEIDSARFKDIASRLPFQPLRPREEVVAGDDDAARLGRMIERQNARVSW